MATLVLVRHGQASFLSEDYDRLSPTGEEQSRRLGERWAAAGARFDAAFVGPRRRQQDTARLVAAAFAGAGLPFPEPVPLDDLDEMQAQFLLQRGVTELVAHNPVLGELLAELAAAGTPAESRRRFQQVFAEVTRRWVRGELVAPDLEPWSGFVARVRGALGRMMEGGEGRGRRVVAFTSGGPVAVAVGHALGAADAATLDLAFLVRNASVSELLFARGEGRFSLSLFNEVAHLPDPALLTYR